MKISRNTILCFGTAILSSFLVAGAQANLPSSAITKLEMPVYGVYITSDPTCMTGLNATMPLSATPTTFDMATGPSIGTGAVPTDGIKCVVIIAKMHMVAEWAAGTYTTTTRFGTSTFNDSNCNPGGSETISGDLSGMGCGMGTRSKAMVWPDQIATDMAAVGLTPTTDCSTSGSGNVFPIFLSTYAKCVGDTASDEAIGGACDWTNNASLNPGDGGYRTNSMFQPPNKADDADHGVHINEVAAGHKKFKLVIDVSPAISGNGGSSCGGLGPPSFAFAALD